MGHTQTQQQQREGAAVIGKTGPPPCCLPNCKSACTHARGRGADAAAASKTRSKWPQALSGACSPHRHTRACPFLSRIDPQMLSRIDPQREHLPDKGIELNLVGTGTVRQNMLLVICIHGKSDAKRHRVRAPGDSISPKKAAAHVMRRAASGRPAWVPGSVGLVGCKPEKPRPQETKTINPLTPAQCPYNPKRPPTCTRGT